MAIFSSVPTRRRGSGNCGQPYGKDVLDYVLTKIYGIPKIYHNYYVNKYDSKMACEDMKAWVKGIEKKNLPFFRKITIFHKYLQQSPLSRGISLLSRIRAGNNSGRIETAFNQSREDLRQYVFRKVYRLDRHDIAKIMKNPGYYTKDMAIREMHYQNKKKRYPADPKYKAPFKYTVTETAPRFVNKRGIKYKQGRAGYSIGADLTYFGGKAPASAPKISGKTYKPKKGGSNPGGGAPRGLNAAGRQQWYERQAKIAAAKKAKAKNLAPNKFHEHAFPPGMNIYSNGVEHQPFLNRAQRAVNILRG